MALDLLETIEGVVDGLVSYHLDVPRDVLYVQLVSSLGQETYGEETDDGSILLRTIDGDRTVGMTIVGYWKRFGEGALRDANLATIGRSVEAFIQRAPLAA